MKARGMAAATFIAIAASACAAVIGLESVGYDDAKVPDEAGDAAAVDGGNDSATEACTGTTCGARCCARGARCLEAGSCSNDVVDVSGGGNSSCAVLADGTLWCWGENVVGALGLGDAGDDVCTFIVRTSAGLVTIADPCRFNATQVPGLGGVTRVAVGFQLACAIVGAAGTVSCWGRNLDGVLGHDPLTDPVCNDLSAREDDGGGPPASTRCTAMPSKVAGVAGAVELVVAERHACARTAKGEVFCWGQNRTGALGNPDAGQLPQDAGPGSVTAVRVQGLPNDVFQIATAIYSGGGCAVSDGGHGWCWGNNIPNQPGSLVARAITEDGGEPPAAAAIPNLAALHFGLTHACALRKDAGVVCWGRNDDGNLGQGGCDTPDQHVPATVIGLPNATALDTRWLHTCALDELGKVWCWGVAQDGALGNSVITGTGNCSSLNSSGIPTQVPGLPRIVRIATGIETTFAVDENGALWAWGANDVARVGHEPTKRGDFVNCGDLGNQTTCNPRPMRVEGLP